MISKIKVNPCRPGHGASCAFCCGSHNYTLQPELVEEIFTKRESNPATIYCSRHPEESDNEKLVQDGMQCPHIGISESEPGIVCCLVYTNDCKKPALKSFFDGTCKNFYCTAWNELTADQVLFAAGLMQDWYYYSLLINCNDLLVELYADYGCPSDVPALKLEEIKKELAQKLYEDDLI